VADLPLVPVIPRNPYAQKLAQDLLPGRPYVADPDFALAKDASIYEKMRRDPVISHALTMRKHLVAGRDWYLEAPNAASKPLVPYFEALLREVRGFTAARFGLAAAVERGYAVAKLEGVFETRPLGPSREPFRWFVLRRLVSADKRRFARFFRDQDGKRSYYWAIFDPIKNAWVAVDHPEHYVWHTYDLDEQSVGHGRGLSEALYYYWHAKTNLFRAMMDGVERWADGWIIAKIRHDISAAPATASVSAALAQHGDRVTQAIEMLEKMRASKVGVIDEREDIQRIETSGTGHQIVESTRAYLDGAMVTLILGANLPTTATSGGSYALAEIQENSTEAIIAYDRETLEDTITEQVLGGLWRWNLPAFRALGLDHLAPPCFRIRHERRPVIAEVLQAITGAQQLQLPILESEAYDRLGWTIPDGTERALTPAAPLPVFPPDGP